MGAENPLSHHQQKVRGDEVAGTGSARALRSRGGKLGVGPAGPRGRCGAREAPGDAAQRTRRLRCTGEGEAEKL